MHWFPWNPMDAAKWRNAWRSVGAWLLVSHHKPDNHFIKLRLNFKTDCGRLNRTNISSFKSHSHFVICPEPFEQSFVKDRFPKCRSPRPKLQKMMSHICVGNSFKTYNSSRCRRVANTTQRTTDPFLFYLFNRISVFHSSHNKGFPFRLKICKTICTYCTYIRTFDAR